MSPKLRDMILKTAKDISLNMGMDLDGDIYEVLGKRYYVDILNNEVLEVE